jgi:hypothetical protein
MYSPDRRWWWDGSRWVPASEAPPDAARPSRSSGPLRFVPGFRSGRWPLAVIASILYLTCAAGAIAGIGRGSLAVAGFWLSLAALGVVATYLVWYRAQPRLLLPLAGAFVIAMGTCTASAANAPTAGTGPGTANRAVPTATAAATAVSTALATPTPVPTPTATSTPTPTATPPPTPAPTPTAAVAAPVHATSTPPAPAPPPPPNLCGAPPNPWGYNFCGGGTIGSPAAGFCSYFACIKNFPNGRGYVEECADGMYSRSGGIQGSCSSHGGNQRPLYG